MIIPGQFHEVTGVSEKFKPQTPVEVGRPFYVSHNYFGNKLLNWRHVLTHRLSVSFGCTFHNGNISAPNLSGFATMNRFRIKPSRISRIVTDTTRPEIVVMNAGWKLISVSV